jgi:hypothetical protein
VIPSDLRLDTPGHQPRPASLDQIQPISCRTSHPPFLQIYDSQPLPESIPAPHLTRKQARSKKKNRARGVRVYLDHVDGLDDAGGEHPGGAAVDEGLDGLPDAGRGRRRLRLLLRFRHLLLLIPDPSGSRGSGLARELEAEAAKRTRKWKTAGGLDRGGAVALLTTQERRRGLVGVRGNRTGA